MNHTNCVHVFPVYYTVYTVYTIPLQSIQNRFIHCTNFTQIKHTFFLNKKWVYFQSLMKPFMYLIHLAYCTRSYIWYNELVCVFSISKHSDPPTQIILNKIFITDSGIYWLHVLSIQVRERVDWKRRFKWMLYCTHRVWLYTLYTRLLRGLLFVISKFLSIRSPLWTEIQTVCVFF